jgi:hypothetical protein
VSEALVSVTQSALQHLPVNPVDFWSISCDPGAMSDYPKTVWVLGAGFSAPLGAPLLPELLSMARAFQVRAYFPNSGLDDLAAIARMYDYGRLVGQWRDAEQCLAMMLNSETDGRQLEVINRIHSLAVQAAPFTQNDYGRNALPKELWTAASRFVAMACAICTLGEEERGLKDERWIPYKHWASSLTCNDTLVSFNYDTVVETVCPMADVVTGVRGPDQHRSWEKTNNPILLKLHGSIDWVLQHDAVVRVSPSSASFPPAKPLIGVPGNGKMAVTSLLGVNWGMACHALKEANEVVFMGYRFPESDSFALKSMMDQIRHNAALRATIVLGPAETPDVIRIRELLRMAGVSVGRQHNSRMYTQDYMLRRVWS